MAYQVVTDTQVTVLHQVTDVAGGSRVTGKAGTITTELLDTAGATSALPISIVEVGATGLYQISFTPDAAGSWLLKATNPAGTDEASEYYTVLSVGTPATVETVLQLTTLAKVKQRLGIDRVEHDAVITCLIDEVSSQVPKLCNRSFLEAERTEYYDGLGRQKLTLRHGPLVSVSNVSTVTYSDGGGGAMQIDATTVEPYLYIPTGLRSEGHCGPGYLRMYSGCFQRGIQNYRVTCTAGFGTTTVEMPITIQHAVTNHVAALFNTREATGLINIQVGDGEINPVSSANLDLALLRAVQPFRFMGVA